MFELRESFPAGERSMPHIQEWHKDTQQQYERLVESMPRQVNAVTGNKDYSTKYYTLKHQ